MSDDDRTALLDQIEGDLGAIDDALARLDAGTYFSCERCGNDIGEETRAAEPLRTLCPSCAPS